MGLWMYFLCLFNTDDPRLTMACYCRRQLKCHVLFFMLLVGVFWLFSLHSKNFHRVHVESTQAYAKYGYRRPDTDPFYMLTNVTIGEDTADSTNSSITCSSGRRRVDKGAIIVGYSKTNTKGCTVKPCLLNNHRGPVRMIYRRRPCMAVKECVTVTVKTKNRLKNCVHMLNSLYKYFPDTKVIIADEIDDSLHANASNWHHIVNDTKYYDTVSYIRVRPGVGYGRYIGAKLADTKYILIADDDYIFTQATNLTKLLMLLEHTDLSIVAGAVNDKYPFDGVFRLWQKTPSSTKATLALYSGAFYQMIPCFSQCYAADIVKNFFLANRREVLQAGSWDIHRLFYEHEDFFFTMRLAGLKVAFCQDVVVNHNTKDRTLAVLRKKYFREWQKHLLQKWRLDSYFYCDKNQYSVSQECKLSRPFA